jgi:hypothetical protein
MMQLTVLTQHYELHTNPVSERMQLQNAAVGLKVIHNYGKRYEVVLFCGACPHSEQRPLLVLIEQNGSRSFG